MLLVIAYTEKMKPVWQIIKKDGTIISEFEKRTEAQAELARLQENEK